MVIFTDFTSTARPGMPLMSQTAPLSNLDSQSHDWSAQLAELAYAHGKPQALAQFKVFPRDFCVTELFDVKLSGEGEHFWLDISKSKLNTEQLAKHLARFAGVAYRDVSYAGLKDYFATTRQWFSVWKPRGSAPQWSDFELDGVQIHRVAKHHRKLKRGTHQGNEFSIVLRDIEGDLAELQTRLEQIKATGVPNYFGEQRFGRDAANMRQAYAMLIDRKAVKSKNLRGMLLSAARSWMFNQVVSARVLDSSWRQLKSPEPANLAGSNSLFVSTGEAPESERLAEFDIHPTAPLWGDKADIAMRACPALHEWEKGVLLEYQDLMQALVGARVDYARRATRCVASNLTWDVHQRALNLNFCLPKGQYATSVLRELVQFK